MYVYTYVLYGGDMTIMRTPHAGVAWKFAHVCVIYAYSNWAMIPDDTRIHPGHGRLNFDLLPNRLQPSRTN